MNLRVTKRGVLKTNDQLVSSYYQWDKVDN